jgi:murein DD-endopeptidase MepM/ murein hydrolase activator NlpD
MEPPRSAGQPAAAPNVTVPPVMDPDIDSDMGHYRAVVRETLVRRGETFMTVLRAAGVSRSEAANAIGALRRVFNPRRLKTGQRITLTLGPETGTGWRLLGVRFEPDTGRIIRIARVAGGGFGAEAIKKYLVAKTVRTRAVIQTSLFRAGNKAGIPDAVLFELIRLYSWDVDFQRDIQPGDALDLLVETFHAPDGRLARHGDILFAKLTLGGVAHRLYLFRTGNKNVGYFDEKGHSARKALMKTPIDGARLSSGYGRRRHPILRYTKMHRGLDFAAPRGTPVYAAGNGTFQRVGRNGAYGKYIRIRHNARYATAYAHLKSYRRGVRRGRRVRQGEIIGYVGSSGRSTGPHLHYEVLVAGRQVNPLRLKLPSGRKLRGRELREFNTVRAAIESRLAGLPARTQLTQR